LSAGITAEVTRALGAELALAQAIADEAAARIPYIAVISDWGLDSGGYSVVIPVHEHGKGNNPDPTFRLESNKKPAFFDTTIELNGDIRVYSRGDISIIAEVR